ncbi:MAG: PASTA domain-containing protein, partial [Tissierellia bacterium]|nr:PASTA domain-containing protein [Tissierellia bacterium]
KPYGVVLQKPQEGIQVKEQSVVSVTINEKTSAVMLKDYVGQNIFDINSELQKLGVELDLQYEESSSIEANLVISQIPKAGTELKE